MSHALIVDDNMVIGRAMQSRLASLGFNSFDHTWNETQAIGAAQAHFPDLVVVGQTIMGDSPIQTANHIGAQFGAPVLLVNSGKCEIRTGPENALLDGPFSLSDIGTAVACALRQTDAQDCFLAMEEQELRAA